MLTAPRGGARRVSSHSSVQGSRRRRTVDGDPCGHGRWRAPVVPVAADVRDVRRPAHHMHMHMLHAHRH
eukprot:6591945-Prymnesium_polylepis.2